jgi:hypothetical protein
MSRSLLTLVFVLALAGEASAQKVLYTIADFTETSIASGATHWFAITGSGGGDAVGSAETRARHPHRAAGTFSCLGIQVNANTFSGANHATLEFRVNGVTSALTVTITAGQTGVFENCSNTVSISANDEINTRLLVGTEATKTLSLGEQWIVFDTDGASGVDYQIGSFANWTTTTGTRYSGLMGVPDDSTVEAAESIKMKSAGTITHLQIWSMAARTDGSSTWTLRKNTADANKVITVNASAAEGAFSSTAGTDTFVSGDLIAVKHTTTGTGNHQLSYQQIAIASDDDTFEMGAKRVEVVAAGAAAQYFGFGDLNTPSTTETNVQLRTPLALTLDHLRAYVRVNTMAAASTLALRVNGATAASITIGAGTTGWIDPGITPVNVAVGDEVNFMLTPSGTGTSLELNSIMVTAEDATVAASSAPGRLCAVLRLCGGE